jgi:CRP-like cAMP-binding protein
VFGWFAVDAFVDRSRVPMADRAAASTAGTVPVVSLSEGKYLFRAGDPADGFFIVSAGQIELLRRGETHGRLALLAAGDVCGEDSAFEGHVRACDARAVTSATLLTVSAALFADLVRVRPELAGIVVGRTAMHLLHARAAGLALAQPGARTPTARFVHVESGTQFPLPAQATVIVGRADPRTRFQPDIELSPVDAHRSLSRRHASLTVAGGDYRIAEEPRVANGTFVNGTKLSAGTAVSLKDGDEVSFGLIRMVFRTT